MFHLKSVLSLCIALALLTTACVLPCHAVGTVSSIPSPTVSAKSAVLIEAQSGGVVYQKSADLPLPMASTTKIMTALVALELCHKDTVITVDPLAVGVEGSSVYLTAGEQWTLEQLLYALLLESANDAAVAIAIGVCGSVEAFAEQMNAKAADLVLENTHFVNPHGLDNDMHYTTALDLARIAAAFLEVPLLRTISSTRKHTIANGVAGSARLLINHNKLLRMYEGCIGLKTGFTKSSGRCLVSAAERDGVTLIAVTIHAPDDWNDHISMLDYGFSRFTSVQLCQRDDFLSPLHLVGGADTYVMVTNQEALCVTLPVQHGKISVTVELPRFEFAPLPADSTEGKAVFRCDLDGDGIDEVIGEVALTTCCAIEKNSQKPGLWQRITSFFKKE